MVRLFYFHALKIYFMANRKIQPQHHSLTDLLKARFESNLNRHKQLKWETVLNALEKHPQAMEILERMEESGGEPDVIQVSQMKDEIWFFDCAAESPAGRRSLCYDRAGLESRKDIQPSNTAVDMASEIGAELLNEEQYQWLQQTGDYDLKTSSWLLTPTELRKKGGALFGDKRYGRCFIYHNGAQSFYAARGFRTGFRIQ